MKKILLLCFVMCSLLSCNISDDNPNYIVEALPIDSVDLPDTFVFGQTHEITLTYTKPSGCYLFNNLLYEIDENQRDVAVIAAFFPDEVCDQTPIVEEFTFNFKVTSTESYTFRFWTGGDENGVDTYLIVEVPVED
ncbi:hypothetical protein [uncultured Psychroserpens sp.]|uniref:hypothetical protein n=1 Tax=uncultured Psychroserpens sp. TaxID=255436 RepID=UPI00261DB613|nr:hypothetical protein [uncultured Psychroserpens sp.]